MKLNKNCLIVLHEYCYSLLPEPSLSYMQQINATTKLRDNNLIKYYPPTSPFDAGQWTVTIKGRWLDFKYHNKDIL